MAIFATSDWGASFIVVLFWLVVAVVVFFLTMRGILHGLELLEEKSADKRKRGRLVILGSCLFPVFCYFAPSILFYLWNGTFPLGRYPDNIREGMSINEVQALLGPPHQRSLKNGEQMWLYYIDSFGGFWCKIELRPDGRVIRTYGN